MLKSRHSSWACRARELKKKKKEFSKPNVVPTPPKMCYFKNFFKVAEYSFAGGQR